MDEIQTIKDRIFIFLEKEDIKKETFYKETGMSASNFKGAALRSDLGADKLARILKVYPKLRESSNLDWLITGEGKLDLSIKKGQVIAGADNTEKLGDLIASLFAQNTTLDKGLSFMQKQLNRIEKSQNEAFAKHNKYLEEILKQSNHRIK